MCRVVLIGNGTKTPNNNLGDYISVHDNNVKLGPAYDSFQVVHIPNITAEQFKLVVDEIIGERIFPSLNKYLVNFSFSNSDIDTLFATGLVIDKLNLLKQVGKSNP